MIYGTGLLALDSILVEDAYTGVQHCAGGTCANALAVVSHLGGKARLIGHVGNDRAGALLLSDLVRSGVDCSLVATDPLYKTPVIVEAITQARRPGAKARPKHRFLFTCPACGQHLARFRPISKQAMPSLRERLAASDIFFFDRVSPAALTAARLASSKGATVAFEPSRSMARSRLLEAMKSSHIVKYSKEVVREPIDEELFESPSQTRLLIETRGARGARFRLRKSKGEVMPWIGLPSYVPSCEVDTAGAGDWFTAGFMLRFSIGDRRTRWRRAQIHQALSFAEALATASISYVGARGFSQVASGRAILRNTEATLATGEVRSLSPAADSMVKTRHLSTDNCPVCLSSNVLMKSGGAKKIG